MPRLALTHEPAAPAALHLVERKVARDPVEGCRYIIEKTCQDTCTRCLPFVPPQVTVPVTPPRRWSKHRPQWGAQYQAQLFATVEDAQAVIDELQIIHAVIVDRCHPWNRG